jgi:hypothetical protein
MLLSCSTFGNGLTTSEVPNMESMVDEPLSISTNYHNKYGTRNSPIGETAFA